MKMNDGPDYIVASREGLYIVNHKRWRRVADGYFFGVAVKGAFVYCFKTVALSDASANVSSGSIVRYEHRGGELTGPELLVGGLDYNCHQIDFSSGAFYVVDTHNQCIVEFDQLWQNAKHHQILPPAPPRSPEHAHMNSILGIDDSIFVMFHNLSRERHSEIVEFDRGFRERRRVLLYSAGCHDITRLEDGRFLYCDSFNGTLARDDGMTIKIDDLFTRGLAVGEDEIAVGSSLFGRRIARALLPGYVTFLDRAYDRIARLYVPAAPTQIRRLDGVDLSFSRPR